MPAFFIALIDQFNGVNYSTLLVCGSWGLPESLWNARNFLALAFRLLVFLVHQIEKLFHRQVMNTQ
jgi:hypothetical protein